MVKGRSGHTWRKIAAQVKANATVCAIGGEPLNHAARFPDPQTVTVHHIRPHAWCLANGRMDLLEDPRNLAATCLHHNSSLGDSTPTGPVHTRDW